MSTEHVDFRECLRQLDAERLRLRELAAGRVKELRAELAEAEQLVAMLADPATSRSPRRRTKASKPASSAPCVTKPLMEKLTEKALEENPGISYEETWELVSDQLGQDHYSLSGAKMIFNSVYPAMAEQFTF